MASTEKLNTHQPGGQSNEMVLHINMRDPSSLLEQEAIGILGVNLIYAVFYQLQAMESFLADVAQDVEQRIEIDYAEVRGAAFEGWDRREILAQLVLSGLAEAVCFPSCGSPAPPIDVLHKKRIVLAPGTFGHLNPAHVELHKQMLASGIQQLSAELDEKTSAPIGFFCFSAMPIWETDPPPAIIELLRRIDALRAACGGDVLLFRERELYNMTDFVNRYTKEPVRFVVGLSLLIRVWEYRYAKLPGSFLEALSRLLTQNVPIYAYPKRSRDLEQSVQDISAIGWQWTETNGWVSTEQLHAAPPLGHRYDYIIASNFLMPLPVPATSLDSQVAWRIIHGEQNARPGDAGK
jgi:hypothetical protein